MNLPITNPNINPTMSSREIAEMTGKQHRNVMRDIKSMLDDIGIAALKYEHSYIGADNTTRPCYNLPEDLTLTLVSGYRADLRYAIVKELEQRRRGDVPAIPQTYAEALRVAADLDEQNARLRVESQEKDATIEAAAPKVEAFDSLMNSDGSYGLQNAGRAIGAKPNLFTRWLKQRYVFYQGSSLIPRARFVQMGVFEVKTTVVDDKSHQRTFVTPKGLEYLRKRVPHNVLIDNGQGGRLI